MKNAATWKPGKYVYKKGRLIASRDPHEVSISSRLTADLVAGLYDAYLKQYCRGRLIDLGCGKVPLYEAYRDYIDEVTCVDWPGSQHGNEYIDLECDLTGPLPFEDGRFETVILSDVLEHIPQPECLWREMHRVLTPGGRVLMNVPFYYPIHETPHDFYRYTQFALQRMAESAYFKILHLDSYGGGLMVLADVMAKKLKPKPLLGRLLARLVQYLARILAGNRAIKNCLSQEIDPFPLGYFMVAEKSLA